MAEDRHKDCLRRAGSSLSIVSGCGEPDCPVLKKWREDSARYAEARREGMRTNPAGWAHADCDHAYGICMGGGA